MDGLDLDAGRHALYVWPAYALSAAVLGWAVLDSWLRARRWRREVERREQDRQP
jgi:heme exporter protein D